MLKATFAQSKLERAPVTPATTPYAAFAAAIDARIVQVTGKITF